MWPQSWKYTTKSERHIDRFIFKRNMGVIFTHLISELLLFCDTTTLLVTIPHLPWFRCKVFHGGEYFVAMQWWPPFPKWPTKKKTKMPHTLYKIGLSLNIWKKNKVCRLWKGICAPRLFHFNMSQSKLDMFSTEVLLSECDIKNCSFLPIKLASITLSPSKVHETKCCKSWCSRTHPVISIIEWHTTCDTLQNHQ